MKKISVLMIATVSLVLVSCNERKDYYYTPTLEVNVSGGTSGQANAPIQVSSSSSYTPYQGGSYWGEGGKAANSHYTPYNDKDRNYNYHRGLEE